MTRKVKTVSFYWRSMQTSLRKYKFSGGRKSHLNSAKDLYKIYKSKGGKKKFPKGY